MTSTAPPSSPRPPALAGVRVLDLSRVLAGPWSTMTLADLGAEVIKIEHPVGGDDTRGWGPPYASGGESAYYLCANRNKKSVALNIATPDGQRLVRALAAQSDVVVENFRLGALARYGLDAPSLCALNPGLVYCSISGYGRESPLAARAGYDYIVQAEGGLMSVTGEADGPPLKVGVAVADLFTGMAATQAILAALLARQRDGRGQVIDMALFDSQLAMLANVGSAYLVSGRDPARHGNAHPTIVPYQTFATRDADIVIAVGNDRQFKALCRDVLGWPELALDERFATNAARVGAREVLSTLLSGRLREDSAQAWLDKLRAAGIPCGSVRSVGEAFESPEAQARAMVRTVAHPSAGSVRLVASPLKLRGTPVVEPQAPPLLGEHTARVLRERLGLPDDEIERLREAGVAGG